MNLFHANGRPPVHTINACAEADAATLLAATIEARLCAAGEALEACGLLRLVEGLHRGDSDRGLLRARSEVRALIARLDGSNPELHTSAIAARAALGKLREVL